MKKTLTAWILAALLLTSLPLTALAGSDVGSRYTDVSGGWYADAVLKYGYDDIFDSGDHKFQPNKKITRIEFVRLLHKALGITVNYFAAPDIKDYCTDMKNEDVGAGDVIDLVTTGILEEGGGFEPQKQLDREVMVHWIVNALNYMTGGNYNMIMIMPDPFHDDAKIATKYKNDIMTGQVLKLILGSGNNMLHPKTGATRAEAITVTARLVDLLATLKQNDSQSVTVTASAREENGALVMSCTIQNNTDKAVTIAHGGQAYDFKLFDKEGDTVYTWSADKFFIAIMTSTTIEPGQSIIYTEKLDKDAWAAVKDSTVSFKAYLTGSSDDFTINTDGYAGEIMLSK